MSLALYSVYRMLNPLQNAARSFIPAQALQSSVCASSAKAPRPLRVARVLEGTHQRLSAGRMVISGRMDDVCAELDRLVELEQRMAR
jgi:hypothetical protein